MTTLSPTMSTKDEHQNVTSNPAVSTVPAHRRARASGFATMGLAIAVGAALTVATGVLAAPGAALGLLAILSAVGGVFGARKGHVTGTGTASLALLLGLAALAVGGLAVMGVTTWPDTTTNNVAELREWLDTHLPWATPDS
jgi:hypothetical protein